MKALGPQNGYVVGENAEGAIEWHTVDPSGPDAEVEANIEGVLMYKTKCGEHFGSIRVDTPAAGLPLCAKC